MLDLYSKKALLSLLNQGVVVITPNNRLSDFLLDEYAIFHQQQVIDKPLCFSYKTALNKAYSQFQFSHPNKSHPTLLTPTQGQYLWRKTLQQESEITLNEGLLKAVIRTWEYCQQWSIDPTNPAFQLTKQTQQFQTWWQLLNNILEEKALIAEYQIIPYLLRENSLFLEKSLIWACFDGFNPQQKQLQAYLKEKGLIQYRFELKTQTSQPHMVAAKNELEETQQLVSWLNLQLATSANRIGVVVPDLHHQSSCLQRLLNHYFDPALFNISLGKPLNAYPLVAHALCWLHITPPYFTQHEVTLLLQSPFLAEAEIEFLSRSQYLQSGLLMEQPMIPWAHFIEEMSHSSPQLAGRLSQLKPFPEQASSCEWIDLFLQRLNELGFPGDNALNSENYQCLQCITQLFDEFRQLQVINSSMGRQEALNTLKTLASEKIFQAQKPKTRIQVSGLLEASGCEFDSLWIMGFDHQCLPQKTQLSPFIPHSLQRELSMPHSCPERELQLAKQIITRFSHSANQVIFSYSQLKDDTSNLPCFLIDLPCFEALEIMPGSNASCLIRAEETYCLPLKTDERPLGGTAILANQAKCPFKAFAEHRLHAKSPLKTKEGLDAQERGKIMHRIMEILWQKWQNQHVLCQLGESSLEQDITQAIHTALAPFKKNHPHSWSTLYEIEQIRLKRLIDHYVDWEKTRPSFNILALEQSYTIHLAGLDFKVRIDRLDQVGDKKWVIDYKSNLPNYKPWNEERPQEPQLLLYALLDSAINTLVLSQLRTGKIAHCGLSEKPNEVVGITSIKKEETWEQYRHRWQQQLLTLAEEFQQGFCLPQPAQITLCQSCDYQSLCRFQMHGE